MKLWLLEPLEDESHPFMAGPWDASRDYFQGFLIRAASEAEARKIAAENGGDETKQVPGLNPWLDFKSSSCKEVTAEGEPGVVMFDFLNA